MPYCPNCRHEYAATVERCIDCGSPLLAGNRPPNPSIDLDFSDLLIPLGALFIGLVGIIMLYLRVAAEAGSIRGPLASVIQAGQPPIMTVFYAIAAIAGVITLALWAIWVFVLRRV